MKRLLCLLLTLVLAAGCFAIAGADEKTLYLVSKGGEGSLTNQKNPWSNWDTLTNSLTFETLLTCDELLVATKGVLADTYEVSEDGLTYTFTLKDGLKWSDGEPLTAADVAWSIQASLRAYNVNGIYTTAFGYIDGAPAYKAGEAEEVPGIAADDLTLTLTLSEPYSPMMNIMAQFAILPMHVLQDTAPDQIFYASDYWEKPVTSGPYMVAEVSTDNYFILERNPHYNRETGAIDKVYVTVVSDVVAEAQAGNTDFVGTNELDIQSILSTLDRYTDYGANVTYIRYLLFNITDGKEPALADARVRKAIAYGVDWKSLAEGLYGEMANLTTSGVLSNDAAYIGETYSYDPDYAKELLTEAGYYNSFADYTLNILYGYTDQTTFDLLEAIIYYLGEIGIKATMTHTTNASQDLWELHAFDLYYGALSAYSTVQWYEQYTKDTFNGVLDSAETFAPLLAEMIGATDYAAYESALLKAQEIEAEERLRIPVYSLGYQFYVSDRIILPDDMVFGNPWYNFDYRFTEWDIAE